jgi:hypothetical protein
MASCECCWDSANSKSFFSLRDIGDCYHEAMREHEERGCECTKDTREGAKLRAGQFWDEERQLDKREI